MSYSGIFALNDHSRLRGLHATLSPSGYHWLNYDDEKMAEVFKARQAVEKGVELHEFASKAIQLGIKLQTTKKSLNSFVNECIGYRMQSEVVLFYNEYCFGTADALRYYTKENILRISDLKTGKTTASMKQLMIYAAIFSLEYKINDFKSILTIYQNDELNIYEPDFSEISEIKDRIIHLSSILRGLNG